MSSPVLVTFKKTTLAHYNADGRGIQSININVLWCYPGHGRHRDRSDQLSGGTLGREECLQSRQENVLLVKGAHKLRAILGHWVVIAVNAGRWKMLFLNDEFNRRSRDVAIGINGGNARETRPI